MKKIISTACILLLLISGGISASDQDDDFDIASNASNIQNTGRIMHIYDLRSEILRCVLDKDEITLQGYISNGIDMNFTCGEEDDTILHVALRSSILGSSNQCAVLIIDHLLKTNKPVASKNKYNDTPLHLALLLADKTCANKLFPHYKDQGVPLNEPDKSGETFLHSALIFGHTQVALDLIDSIVKNKENINHKDTYDGHTPLHKAVFFARENRKHDYDEIIKKILSYDASSLMIDNSVPNNPYPNDLKTPLDTALFYGAIDVVDLLIDNAPGNVLKNWRSARVKDADLMLVLETLGLSDTDIQNDEQQRKTIKEKFSSTADMYTLDLESHENIMGKLAHKCGTDRYAGV